MKWKNISSAERMEIGILRSRGCSMREIAEAMGRSPNTISYELRKNKVKGKYDSKKANDKSRLRKRMRRFQWMKIEENRELKNFIIEGLQKKWNPDEIS